MKTPLTASVFLFAAAINGCGGSDDGGAAARQTAEANQGKNLIAQGRHIFRFDTFGDEAKWTDTLDCMRSLPPRSIRRPRCRWG
jgi:hypothetical protein